jgi:hypothetical protein
VRGISLLAVGAAALSLAGTALGGGPGHVARGDDGATHSQAAADNATLLIRGRAWSLDGGPFEAHQRLTLVHGSTLTVLNGALVETAGARVRMHHLGTATFVAFGRSGTYRFRSGTLTVTVVVR